MTVEAEMSLAVAEYS